MSRNARPDNEHASLRAATKALKKGDSDHALEALLEAWRAHRAPEIAKLVEGVSRTLTPHLPELGGKLNDFQPAWLAVAKQKRAADLPRLLDSVLATTNRFGTAVVKALIERGDALAKWPADPRVAARVVAHLRAGGYESTSRSTLPFWSQMFAMLRTQGDVRASELLRPIRFAKVFKTFSDGKRRIEWFQREADALLAELDSNADRPQPKNAKRRAGLLADIASLVKAAAKSPVSAAVLERLRAEPTRPRKPRSTKRRAPERAGNVSSDLREAKATSDDRTRLAALTSAWRRTPDVRIANLVDRVSARLEARSPRISGATRAQVHKNWRAVAKKKDPADLPRLLSSITDTRGRSTDALERLEALQSWPADPRTSRLVAEQLEVPPFHSSSTFQFWDALIELAAAHGDGRAADAFDSLAGRYDSILETTYATRSREATWFQKRLSAAATRLRQSAAATLNPKDSRAMLALAKQIADDVGEKLLARVYENPGDDGARAVYGDHLQEAGDPRGEFIALQLAEEDDKRASEIASAHSYTWLGPLFPFLDIEQSRFEAGFLSHAALSGLSPQRLAAVVDLPVWSTVRSIDFGWINAQRFVVTPAMRSLERVTRQTDSGPRALRRVHRDG